MEESERRQQGIKMWGGQENMQMSMNASI